MHTSLYWQQCFDDLQLILGQKSVEQSRNCSGKESFRFLTLNGNLQTQDLIAHRNTDIVQTTVQHVSL